MTMRATLMLLGLCGLLACGSREETGGTASAPPPPTSAPPAAPAGRTISAEARQAMKDRLSAQPAGRKAWILSQPGNAEVAALAGTLATVFKEAGWEVTAETASGISLKPGLMTLVAEE